MPPSKKTCYDPTTSIEAIITSPLNLPYMTQTEYFTTIKYLLYNFDDKFKESLKKNISDQDAGFDAEPEKKDTDFVTPDQKGFYQVFIKNR